MKRKFLLLFILCLLIITGCKKENNNVVEKEDTKVEEKEVENVVYKDLSIEYGSDLPKINDYLEEGKVEETEIIYKDKNNEEIKAEDLKVGVYKVLINDKEVSKLEIVDTTKPTLKLKEVSIKNKAKYSINDFVESCTDNSEVKCHLRFKEKEMATYTKAGTYDIVIIASDDSENSEELTTKLTIKKQDTPKKPTTNTTNKKPTTSTEQPVDNTNAVDNKEPTTEATEPQSNEEVTYKYGTKITKKNGSIEFDYSSFNGTTKEMLGEAKGLVTTNNGIYNEVLKFTNIYRTEKQVAPLTLDDGLSAAATVRAMEIAYANMFSHTRPNGSSCFTVISESGSTGWRTLGENIAYGYPTAEAVTAGWRESPGHYANMINSNFTKLGVGRYELNGTVYFVQLFGG